MKKQQVVFKQRVRNAQKKKEKSEMDMDKKTVTLFRITKFVTQQQFAASSFDEIRNHIIEMVNIFERDADAEL